ncbi:MAG TPA: hypothetical protein VKI64_00195 [Acidimicrobiales bacterium]|nr:hypothetical protein [Acidimicrobiales bacterium]
MLRAGRLTAALAVAVLVLPGVVMPGVNNWAHLGGLACGGLLGLRLPALARHGGRTHTRPERAVLGTAVALAVLAVADGAQQLGQLLLEPA